MGKEFSPFKFFMYSFFAVASFVCSATITYFFFAGVFTEINKLILIGLSITIVGLLYLFASELNKEKYIYVIIFFLMAVSLLSSVGGIKQRLLKDFKTEESYNQKYDLVDKSIKLASKADSLITDRRRLAAENDKNIWFKYNNIEKAENTFKDQVLLMSHTMTVPVDSLDLSGFYLLSKDISGFTGINILNTQLIILIIIAFAIDLPGTYSWYKLNSGGNNSKKRNSTILSLFHKSNKVQYMDFETYATKLWTNVPKRFWRDKCLYSSNFIPIKAKLERRYRALLEENNLIRTVGTVTYSNYDYQSFLKKVREIAQKENA